MTPTLFWESYEYLPTDAWNIASVTDEVTQSVGNAFTYDDHDQISTGGFTYSLGDLTGMSYGGDVRSYAWTASARMVHSDVGTTTADYAYDPWKRLVASRTDGSTWEMHLWDGWYQLGMVEAGSGGRAASVAWGPAGPIGEKRAGLPYQPLMVDPTGSIKLGLSEFPLLDPHGGTIAAGSASSILGFHVHERRDEAAAVYMRHRWYDVTTRRFLSRDPVLASDVASFAYAGGNPVLRWDPLGLYSMTYDVTSHQLVVRFDDGRRSVTFNAMSGTGDCRDNPHCRGMRNEGPIPSLPTGTMWRVSEPVETEKSRASTNKLKRLLLTPRPKS